MEEERKDCRGHPTRNSIFSLLFMLKIVSPVVVCVRRGRLKLKLPARGSVDVVLVHPVDRWSSSGGEDGTRTSHEPVQIEQLTNWKAVKEKTKHDAHDDKFVKMLP